jgi:hypothetical protein
MPPVESWMLVGGGGMDFMTILINYISMLAQCSHPERYWGGPQWGRMALE